MSDLMDAPFVRTSLPDAPFAPSVMAASLQQHFGQYAPRAATSFQDYIDAGFQQSVTGLAARRKAPDVAVTADSPWYGRFLSNVVGMGGDFPAMVPGFLAGAPVGGAVAGAAGSVVPVAGTAAGIAAGGLIGGFAGANALPAALRTVMMDAYTRGEVNSSSEFIDRALHVAWETTKAGVVGGATGGAGIAAKAALPVAAGAATKIAVPLAAEVTTMTTVAKALEGELPEPQDFMDAAFVIGGIKGAGSVAGKLRTIYAKTGIPPEQVVADTARDQAVRNELLQPGEEVPKSYEPVAAAETARQIVPGEKAQQVAASPFAVELPQAPGEPTKPTHVNYNYIDSLEKVKLAMARLSEVYEQEIQTQRRGTVSWAETEAEVSKQLNDLLGGKAVLPAREPGTASSVADLLMRKQMTVGAAEDVVRARDELLAKGADSTLEDQAAFLASIERAAMIQSEFLGARAEAGRALNILKSTAIDAERAAQIQKAIDSYTGGAGAKALGAVKGTPLELAEMLKQIDDPVAMAKFARDAVKATAWEKVVEAWKASILSGPVTHMANIMGNTVFAAMRAPIEVVAAGFGALRGGSDRVMLSEPVARVTGFLAGAVDGLKTAGAILKTGEDFGKAEQYRKAIEGTKGEIVRLPFRFLSAEDAVFRTMNERGELYTQASRIASQEGLNPLSREFRERVVQLVQEPTPEMQASAEAAGERFTFNTELGEKGKALQDFVRQWHLEMIVPFIRTPGNIMKELARMTPLAPLVKEWRTAFSEGGAARDKAMAELAVGSSVMALVFIKALDGQISGQGSPDAGKRRIDSAAGWQPYSVKIGNTWYSYQRLQPVGTLIGMAADIAEVWDHLNEKESDKVPKMLSVAFANAVTNQTFLQGITNLVNAMSDPKRFGPRLVQQYAGSVVPNIVGQTTAMYDPVVREVYDVIDAVKARVPGLRQELLPKRDPFGQPIQTKERLGGLSPITETEVSQDKVRTEASRLGVSVADTPKKTHIGRGSGKLGDVKLEPEERDRFASIGGQLAHEVLTQMVNSAGWDDLPPILQRRAYERVFSQAHRVAAQYAIPPEKRIGLLHEITEKVNQELTK